VDAITPPGMPEGHTTGQGQPGDVGESGTFPPPPAIDAPLFFTSLPDDLRADPRMQRFAKADNASMAKTYLELEKKLGERGIKPLSPESTPEDVIAYRSAMGVPEKPDGYDFGELPYPEAATPTEAQMAGWKKTFHDLHLTPTQVQGIMQAHAREMSQEWNAIDSEREAQNRETMQALTKQYGADAPALLRLAHEYVKRRWGDAGVEALDFHRGGAGSSPVVIGMLIESAKLTGHDKFIVADTGGNLMDAKTAQDQVNVLYGKLYQAKREGKEGDEAAIKQEIERLSRVAFS
jgi:hypothetical protein